MEAKSNFRQYEEKMTPLKPFSLVCPQVTYRVVQVTDDQLEATADGTGAVSVVSTAAFAGAPQAVAQVSKHTARLQQV